MVWIFIWGQQGSSLPNDGIPSNSAYGDGLNGAGNGNGIGSGDFLAFTDGGGFGVGINNSSFGSGPL